jgi:hypothetical protein
VSVLVESNIEFDFSRATQVIEHDKQAGDGNSVWPGVDFRIEDPPGWIWLEVKSWDPTHIAPARRGGTRWSFICKMKSKPFAAEMRNKFLGTTAFLAWTNAFPLSDTRYIILFVPPKPLDKALLGTHNQLLRGHFPKTAPWAQPIRVSVLTIAEWNLRFPQYPAHLLP